MPYHLTQDSLRKDDTELAAIHTVWVMAYYKKASILRMDVFDLLYQRPVTWVAAYNYVTHFVTDKQKGDFDDQDKIPFSIFRPQAIARNFDQTEHFRDSDKPFQERACTVRSLALQRYPWCPRKFLQTC